MYPGGFSGDSSYITDVWDLCGGRSADGSCCLWHKKQKRDFTGSRGNLPYIGGSWRSHAGACRKQPGRNLTKWMPESFLVRLFLAAGAVFLCVWLSRFLRLLSIRKEENRHLRNVTLFYAGQTIKTRGLIDTGNHLKAPVSGLPVHVATAGLMKRLCPAVKGVMYVPYQCIGSSGILPAVRIDEMKVEGEKGSFVIPKPWIAITKGSLSPHNEYEVLIQKNDKGLQV